MCTLSIRRRLVIFQIKGTSSCNFNVGGRQVTSNDFLRSLKIWRKTYPLSPNLVERDVSANMHKADVFDRIQYIKVYSQSHLMIINGRAATNVAPLLDISNFTFKILRW